MDLISGDSRGFLLLLYAWLEGDIRTLHPSLSTPLPFVLLFSKSKAKEKLVATMIEELLKKLRLGERAEKVGERDDGEAREEEVGAEAGVEAGVEIEDPEWTDDAHEYPTAQASSNPGTELDGSAEDEEDPEWTNDWNDYREATGELFEVSLDVENDVSVPAGMDGRPFPTYGNGAADTNTRDTEGGSKLPDTPETCEGWRLPHSACRTQNSPPRLPYSAFMSPPLSPQYAEGLHGWRSSRARAALSTSHSTATGSSDPSGDSVGHSGPVLGSIESDSSSGGVNGTPSVSSGQSLPAAPSAQSKYDDEHIVMCVKQSPKRGVIVTPAEPYPFISKSQRGGHRTSWNAYNQLRQSLHKSQDDASKRLETSQGFNTSSSSYQSQQIQETLEAHHNEGATPPSQPSTMQEPGASLGGMIQRSSTNSTRGGFRQSKFADLILSRRGNKQSSRRSSTEDFPPGENATSGPNPNAVFSFESNYGANSNRNNVPALPLPSSTPTRKSLESMRNMMSGPPICGNCVEGGFMECDVGTRQPCSHCRAWGVGMICRRPGEGGDGKKGWGVHRDN